MTPRGRPGEPIPCDLTGAVVVVTGASAGIGKEVARGLVRRNAHVVLACRDLARGEAARADLARGDAAWHGPGPDELGRRLEVALLDAADRASIAAFAAGVAARHGRLDVLVNNAGVWLPRREETPEGLERTFATNVLGYHRLTRALAPLLAASAPARVVNVASRMAWGLDLTDLGFARRAWGRGAGAYAQSKQANRMLSWSWAERLRPQGVTVHALHPGVVATEIARAGRGLVGLGARAYFALVGRSPAEGADTAVWLAAEPALDGVTGLLWQDRREVPCGFRDPAARAALWEAVEAFA